MKAGAGAPVWTAATASPLWHTSVRWLYESGDAVAAVQTAAQQPLRRRYTGSTALAGEQASRLLRSGVSPDRVCRRARRSAGAGGTPALRMQLRYLLRAEWPVAAQ